MSEAPPETAAVAAPRSPALAYADPARSEVGLDQQFLPPLLLQYWHTLRRRRWTIAGIVVAALAAGLAITLLTPPQYTARAQIEISRQQKNITKVEGVEDQQAGRDLEFYATQYSLLKAVSLAQRVEKALKLASSDAFFAAHGAKPATGGIEARRRQAVQLLLGNVAVEPIRTSRLVDIKYTSRSPELAAQVTNAWVREFIGASMDREYNSTADARRFLEQRLTVLRSRVEESEREVSNYASARGIVSLDVTRDADGKTQTQRTLASTDLEAMNIALNQARAERIAAQSRAGGAADSSPEALSNGTLSSLRQRRGEVAAEYAKILTQFGTGYPAARALKGQLDALDTAIARETSRVATSRRQALTEAAARERELAAKVANLKAELDRQQRDTIQYNIYVREADTNRQLYDALLQRYKEIGVAGAVGASNIAIVDPADAPRGPSSPNLPRNLALALLIGLGLAGVVVLALEQIDEGIKGPADVWSVLQVPLLGNVPLVGGDPVAELGDPRSYLAEAYFSIRSALAFSTTHGLPRSLCVTSSRTGEGKSTSALALAVTIGRTGKSVLLVDGDLRSPSVHELTDLPNLGGFSNLLAGDNQVEQYLQPTRFRGLSVLSSGPLPPSPSELLASERLHEVVRALLSRYDYVVFDAPPVLGLSDGPLIARASEGCLFVIEPGAAPVRGIRDALQRLRLVGAQVFGVAVTKIDVTRQHYGYSYGYGYGSNEDGSPSQSPARA